MNEERTQQLQTRSEDAKIVVTAPTPLPNKALKVRKLYTICFVCMLLGLLISPLLGIGFLGLLVSYSINYYFVDIMRSGLRDMKFQFVNGVDNENLMTTMHPIFAGKYGNMLVEQLNGGVVSIRHNDHIYDIQIQEDDSFIIWWRMSVGNAFFRLNDYKSYLKILSSMGIIAYEIQNAYGIHPSKEEQKEISVSPC